MSIRYLLRSIPDFLRCPLVAILCVFAIAGQGAGQETPAMEDPGPAMILPITPQEVEQQKAQVYYREIDECLARGDNQGAVACYDRMFKEMPEYGKDTGEIVTLQYHRAVAYGFDRYSKERTALFENIWNDPTNADYLQIYNIGRMIVCYHYESGDYEGALSYAIELNAKLEANYDAIPEEARSRFGIDIAYRESLVYAARSYAQLGNPEAAEKSYRTLLDRFPGSIFEEEAQTALKELEGISHADAYELVASSRKRKPGHPIESAVSESGSDNSNNEALPGPPSGMKGPLQMPENTDTDPHSSEGGIHLYTGIALALAVAILAAFWFGRRKR